jgi:hypothetical protein
MKLGSNLIWVPDARITSENVIVFPVAVVEGKAESGTVCNRITANWRCSEFSSVSSKGGKRKERNAGEE